MQDRRFPLIFIPIFFITAVFFLPWNSFALIGVQEGDIPKEITLIDLNGKTVNVTGLYGNKPVIIVFWELVMDKSYLNYSLDELLFLNDIYGKYHEKEGLEIFGIYTPVEENDISEGEIAEVRNLIRTYKIGFPILIDKGFKMFREYGVIALPSTIMVGKSAKIEFVYPSFPIAALPLFLDRIQTLIGVREVLQQDDIKITGKDSQAVRLYNYSLQMYKKGLKEQALSPLKKALSLDPEYAWSHNLMGIILWDSGNVESSKDEFSRVIELDEKNAAAHFNYGLLLFNSEKHEEAEKYFKSALALNSNMAEAHYFLGLLYSQTNNSDSALKEFETVLDLFDGRKSSQILADAGAYYRISSLMAMSAIYDKRGNKEVCFTLLQKAVQITLGIEGRSDKAGVRSGKGSMLYE